MPHNIIRVGRPPQGPRRARPTLWIDRLAGSAWFVLAGVLLGMLVRAA